MVLPSSETHTEIATDAPAVSMTPEETLLMVEDWLRNDPGLSFKRASTDLQKLNLVITPRQFSEVKRRLGITTGPPRPTPSRPAAAVRAVEPNGVPKTPLMTFIVE